MKYEQKTTFKSNPVALQAIHGLLEESLTRRRHSGDVILFPFDGSVNVFKNFLDRVCNFCTNTISRNEGDL